MTKSNDPLLTNEFITKLYDNNFNLAKEVIKIAHNYIKSGKEFSLASLLDEVAKSKEEASKKLNE